MTYNLSELLELALHAAEIGAEITLQQADFEVSQKGSRGDVVTAVDKSVETQIRGYLQCHRPNDLIRGEEFADSGIATADICWYLDPIDGTSNFVAGIPYFCTSVAAYSLVDRRWVAGVITAPALGRTYWAAQGLGAWRITARGKQRLHARPRSEAPRLLATGFSYDRTVREQQFASLATYLDDCDDIRSLGSAALGLCAVAEGAACAFIETDLYIYDWAAGAMIVEEAGGHVVRPETTRGAITAVGQRTTTQAPQQSI